MSAATALLQALRLRGVEVTVRAGRLYVRAPAGTLTAADRAALAQHREALRQLLGAGGPTPDAQNSHNSQNSALARRDLDDAAARAHAQNSHNSQNSPAPRPLVAPHPCQTCAGATNIGPQCLTCKHYGPPPSPAHGPCPGCHRACPIAQGLCFSCTSAPPPHLTPCPACGRPSQAGALCLACYRARYGVPPSHRPPPDQRSTQYEENEEIQEAHGHQETAYEENTKKIRRNSPAPRPGSAPPSASPGAADRADPRARLRTLGRQLGWPRLPLRPGVFLAAGETSWETFRATAPAPLLHTAVAAAEAALQEGDRPPPDTPPPAPATGPPAPPGEGHRRCVGGCGALLAEGTFFCGPRCPGRPPAPTGTDDAERTP